MTDIATTPALVRPVQVLGNLEGIDTPTAKTVAAAAPALQRPLGLQLVMAQTPADLPPILQVNPPRPQPLARLQAFLHFH